MSNTTSPFQLEPNQRMRSPKGRTDLGVGAQETGAYVTRLPGTKRDCVVYRLRCLNDGFTRDFVDDGGDSRGPLNGRQALQHVLLKESFSYEGDDAVSYPVFFADKRLPAQFAKVGKVAVPVADKAIKAECEARMKTRQARREGRNADFEQQKIQAATAQLRTEEAARAHMQKGGGNAPAN